jgi:hypothetical protein
VAAVSIVKVPENDLNWLANILEVNPVGAMKVIGACNIAVYIVALAF